MKKALVFLLACLASTAMFAQTLHYQIDQTGCQGTYTTVTGVLMIDGVETYNGVGMQDAGGGNLEIGVFDTEGICRGAKFPTWRSKSNQWIYQLQIRGNNGFTYPTFKVYDHATETEWDLILDIEETIEWTSGGKYGSLNNPFSINFTSPAPAEPTPWGTEFEEDIPTVADDVTITEDVIIPNGYVAYANEITIEEGATLYIEEGGQLIHNGEVEVTMLMNVVGYGTAKEGNNAGYRLFASPVHSTATNSFIPVDGTNLNTGTFDLYKFDESQDLEWINYKLAANNFTNLVLGQGYLYANEASIDNAVLRGFTVSTAENYAVNPELSYTAGVSYAGWNLVGNPYTCNAYVMNGSGYMPYYVLNTNGDGIEGTVVAAGTPIAPMQGLFVKASATDQSCTFTTEAPSAKGSLNIMVNQGRGMVDNAILSFGEGSNLEKLQFNPNHTKVYMTQDGEDYAVVSAPEMGEMPVSFKAESNGSYTLSFTAEEVSFNYLHLIDNLTGIETDLLATPSYSFNAQTTDYASRFRLVFATGNNSNDDSFAFFSNGNLVINNEGNATLQVIDVTGRILSSETINGCASLSVNGAAGVYMIRLINGENVKVQKVVVK